MNMNKMRLFTSTEKKIFFTLLILYIIFAGFSGWNEKSIMSQTLALGIDKSLAIDNYVNDSRLYHFDRVLYDNHWYSDKAPGISFIGSVYIRALYMILGQNILSNNTLFYLSLIIVISLTSAIATSGTSVLIFRILKIYNMEKTLRIFMALFYGLGTIAFFYGTRYRTHSLATFLCLLSFYLLQYKKKLGTAGLCTGFALISDYTTGLFFLGFLVLLSINKITMNKTFHFIAGIAFPALVLLAYNYLIYGNPFHLTYEYYGYDIWPRRIVQRYLLELPYLYSNILVISRNIFQLLFLSYRGLFFYSPILILSLLGIPVWYRRDRSSALIVLAAVVSMIVFVASRDSWWCHGGAGACRRLLIITPFLFIPMGIYINQMKRKWIAYALGAVSIIINLILIQPMEYFAAYNYGINATDFRYTILNFYSTIANPLFDNYIPRFLAYGPHSELIELILGKPLLPFLNLTIAVWIGIFIWRKELFRPKLKKYAMAALLIPLFCMGGAYAFREQAHNYAVQKSSEYYLDKPPLNQSSYWVYPHKYYDNYVGRYTFNIPYILKIDNNLISINEKNRNWYIPWTYPASQRNHTQMRDNASVHLNAKETRNYTLILEVAPVNSDIFSVWLNHQKVDYFPLENYTNIELNLTMARGENVIEILTPRKCTMPPQASKRSKCVSLDIYRFELQPTFIS